MAKARRCSDDALGSSKPSFVEELLEYWERSDEDPLAQARKLLAEKSRRTYSGRPGVLKPSLATRHPHFQTSDSCSMLLRYYFALVTYSPESLTSDCGFGLLSLKVRVPYLIRAYVDMCMKLQRSCSSPKQTSPNCRRHGFWTVVGNFTGDFR